jgi:hypothetical protein
MEDLSGKVLKTTELQKKSVYVNTSGNQQRLPLHNDLKEKLFNKATKLYDKLINSEMSIFSSKNNLMDLLVRNEGEMALLQNYRIQKYEQELAQAKKLYKNLLAK